jgi:hypothetical protein
MILMGDLVNLNRFRKRSEREQEARQAAGNRARFGRSKAERDAADRRAQRANEVLDQHRIDDEGAR